MSQSNLVKEVSEKTKIPQSEVKTVYNQLFKSSADHLKRGHGVKFQGLGIMNS